MALKEVEVGGRGTDWELCWGSGATAKASPCSGSPSAPKPGPPSHCGGQLMRALESEEKRKKEGVLENPFCWCKVAGLSG